MTDRNCVGFRRIRTDDKKTGHHAPAIKNRRLAAAGLIWTKHR